jgi:hypothetical protein
MVAQAATPDRTEPTELHPPLATLFQVVLAATAAMMMVVSTWLAVRRVGGQLQEPFSLVSLLAAGLVGAALVSVLRLGWLHTGFRPQRFKSTVTALWFLPSVSFLLLAFALSIPGTSSVALTCFWMIVLLLESGWAWHLWRVLRNRRRVAVPVTSDGPAVATATNRHTDSTSGSGEAALVETGNASLPTEICQQLTRTSAEQDGDTIAGVLRTSFLPGERSRSLHVAFCPPMIGRPRVDVVQLSGPKARVKAAEVQSFGARFDLRLPAESTTNQTVLIQFAARYVESDRLQR